MGKEIRDLFKKCKIKNLLFLFILILFINSCKKNENTENASIQYFSKYIVETLEEMMYNVYAKGLEESMKESLKLAEKVNILLQEKDSLKEVFYLLNKTYHSGKLDKQLKLTAAEKLEFIEKLKNAERKTNKFEQLNAIHKLMRHLLYIRGLRLDAPRIVLKQPDTLRLKSNRKYKFPIEVIHKKVGGSVYEIEENKKEIEIATGDFQDSILEKKIHLKFRNRVTNERFGIEKRIYIKMIE